MKHYCHYALLPLHYIRLLDYRQFFNEYFTNDDVLDVAAGLYHVKTEIQYEVDG